MQVSSTNNSPNFSGITPIRVFNNGVEVLEKDVIKNACSKAIKAFSGPLESKYKPAAAQLAVRDADYSYLCATNGYVDRFVKSDAVPSDYIKAIYDKNGRGYLVTGPMCIDLSALGYNIGLAMKQCKAAGLRTSDALEQAKTQYWDYVKSIGNNMFNRSREAFNKVTGEKSGAYQEMRLDISTKPHKVKGKIVENVSLENISFNNRHMQG